MIFIKIIGSKRYMAQMCEMCSNTKNKQTQKVQNGFRKVHLAYK